MCWVVRAIAVRAKSEIVRHSKEYYPISPWYNKEFNDSQHTLADSLCIVKCVFLALSLLLCKYNCLGGSTFLELNIDLKTVSFWQNKQGPTFLWRLKEICFIFEVNQEKVGLNESNKALD